MKPHFSSISKLEHSLLLCLTDDLVRFVTGSILKNKSTGNETGPCLFTKQLTAVAVATPC